MTRAMPIMSVLRGSSSLEVMISSPFTIMNVDEKISAAPATGFGIM